MKVTIQSVAERAAVSIGTVSRVLNHDPTVSAGLSERVRNSIDELGYKPLRKRQSAVERAGLAGKTVGLLTLGMDRSLARLPVITAAIDGIREALGDFQASLQMVDASDPAVEPAWLKRNSCDAWLTKGAMQGNVWKSAHPLLREHLESVPCVWFFGRPHGAPGSGVSVNDWETGALAASHLHEKGHRQVAYLSPKKNHTLLQRRQHGFVARCEELGLECRVAARDLQSWTFPLERPKSLAAVESLLKQLLGGKQPPTAIFAPADSIAVLLYRALAEKGHGIPKDISVISANREEGLIAGLYPDLTTIDVRAAEVGREAVALLDRCFRPEREPVSQDVQLDPVLVDGESVKPL